MTQVSLDEFSHWLQEYGRAWQTGDPVAAARLFSEEARYEETPFDPPMVGREAISRYWDEGANRAQRDVRFDYQILAVRGKTGIAAWQASFIRIPSGIHVALDGVLTAEFSEAGVCVRFREWWHRHEDKN